MEKMSKVEVLKKYFDRPPLTLSELKNLNAVERTELAMLAAKELGVELITK